MDFGFYDLLAAGQIFIFEVYWNGTEFVTEDHPIKRLRFSQDLSNGHFYAYADADGDNNTDERPVAKKLRIEMAAFLTFPQPLPFKV